MHANELALGTYLTRIKHHVCLVIFDGASSSLIKPRHPDYNKLALALACTAKITTLSQSENLGV